MKHKDLLAGMNLIVTDDGFRCLNKGDVVQVHEDHPGKFHVPCNDYDGRHFLDGQKDESGELVGLDLAPEQPLHVAEFVELLKLRETVATIAMKASGGLCQFTAEGKHVFLKEIDRLCKMAGFDVHGAFELPEIKVLSMQQSLDEYARRNPELAQRVTDIAAGLRKDGDE